MASRIVNDELVTETRLCYNLPMQSAASALDHLVLATPDLIATATWLERATGVVPTLGGRHVGYGTRNMLCSLGPTSYLEIIGPDPEQGPPSRPRLFGIDDLGGPAIAAWAIAVKNIEAAVAAARSAGHDPGEPRAMQRERPDGRQLSWKLTASGSATIPFLIDWADSPHPASDAAPGLVLDDLRARHPDPGQLTLTLETLGVTMAIESGPEELLASLRGPRGSLDLS